MNLVQIDREIADTESRLAKLKHIRSLVVDLGKMGSRPDTPPKASNALKSQGNTGSRAPKGALEDAILAAVKEKAGMVNREIRAKIKATGYKFSLSALHVGKTLTKLVAAKKLVQGHKGNRVEYSVTTATNNET